MLQGTTVEHKHVQTLSMFSFPNEPARIQTSRAAAAAGLLRMRNKSDMRITMHWADPPPTCEAEAATMTHFALR